MPAKIRLVLVHRERMVREALCALLRRVPDVDVVGEESDGPRAVELVERLRPRVLVAGAPLPGLDAVGLAREVAHRAPGTCVVVLSPRAEAVPARQVLRAGARGLLLESCTAESLVETIRRVAGGEVYVCPRATGGAQAVAGARTRRGGAEAAEPRVALTKRELQVLRLVAEGLGDRAIGRRLGISPRTSEAHRANIRRKLGCRGTTELVRHAVRLGLVSLDDPGAGARAPPPRRRRGRR